VKTSGLDHINLTVSNLERARRFYGDLLGFALESSPLNALGEATSYAFFVGDVEIVLMTHAATRLGDRFDETHPGLDHLSFRAPDEAALYELADRLIQAGVDTQGVEMYEPSRKKYVAFRDPDNIQLEYWLDIRQP